MAAPLAILCSLTCAPGLPAIAAPPKTSSARALVDRVLGYLGLKVEACPAEIADQWPGRATLCAPYGSNFSSFKLDVETTLRRYNIASAVTPVEPWTLRDGRYRRVVEVEGEQIVVVFDENAQRVMLALPGEEGAIVEEVTSGRPVGPRIAGFGGVTTPRVRAEGRVVPRYPEAAQRLEISGTVSLEVLVRSDGSVGRVNVLRVDPEGWEFERAAVEAVRQWTFDPSRYQGKPVDALHTIHVTFGPAVAAPGDGKTPSADTEATEPAKAEDGAGGSREDGGARAEPAAEAGGER